MWVEKAFKEQYKEFNIRGEWFDIDPDEAVKLAAHEISDIGPRFYTEDELIKAMKRDEEKRMEALFTGSVDERKAYYSRRI